VVRELTDDEIAWKSEGTATYQELARRSAATMVEVTPLAEMEEGRRRLDVSDLEPLYRRKDG
jgi:phenylacetic acid degradation protein